MQYDNIDIEIIKLIQADLPVENRPYRDLAEKLDISEEEIIFRICRLKEEGIIRRIGAILRHQKAGFKVNAMVAWKVDESRADKIGNIMAGYDKVSHCYLRDVPEEFGYNLFTMIHACSEEQLIRTVKDISNSTAVCNYIILRSQKELKKSSMVYF